MEGCSMRESFAAYINNIKDAALVLQSAAPEGDIITNTGEGLHPIQLLPFVFQQTPWHFPNLDHLATVDQVLHVHMTCVRRHHMIMISMLGC
jgi:hypothetical protein